MNSRIVTGKVMHARLEPLRHEFTYPVYFYLIDLDELGQLDQGVVFFGHNRFRPVSLRDADYLAGSGTILEKAHLFLKQNGATAEISKILLVTSARYFNRVFNPVNFYFCYTPSGTLEYVLAEVNNTFHETHLYILRPHPVQGKNLYQASTDKAFHVSPFNDLREKLDIRIDLVREERTLIVARIWGEMSPLNTLALSKTILRYPFSAALTMPRILWQAARLYLKKLPIISKPIPNSSMTIRKAPPTRLERFSMDQIFFFLGKLKKGSLKLTLPDGSDRFFGDPSSSIQADLSVKSFSFFWRCLKDADIGFGESFMAEEWETNDLVLLLQLLIENQDAFNDRDIKFAWLGRQLNRLRHRQRRNTPRQSKANIRDHYDLSNDFFQTFLDPRFMYSCALFHHPDESLEQAQINKLRALIRKAAIQPGDHVLEIGSGWGSFALEAARLTGCRVTSITLSEEQLKLARLRARQEGLEDRVQFQLCDYRSVEGEFDKIVSIEMLEAVGQEYYGAFFAACDRLLKPGGLVVLQVITIPDQRYETYRKGSDWIQKYIFPGGMLPSLTALCQAMTDHSRLIVEDLENVGIHYARTLRLWRENFLTQTARVQALGFDRCFQRMWLYYLCYCEAGFATRTLGDLHLVLTRPNNLKLPEFGTLLREIDD
jgi:cyclopropane-fatty-acyl-phospholipid synthase